LTPPFDTPDEILLNFMIKDFVRHASFSFVGDKFKDSVSAKYCSIVRLDGSEK